MRVTDEKFAMPSEVAARGSTVDLCEQFMLSTSMDTPDGWDVTTIGNWRLAHHPTLPVITLHDGAATIGWILGYPITADGRLHPDGSRIAVDTDPISLVDDLGGRFLAIVAAGEHPAVYPDAAGSYSSVYCPTLQIAASTPTLIPYESNTTDRDALIERLGIPRLSASFPYGMTLRHGIDRLLPNHHLDLRTWEMVRHGPRRRYERGELSVEETAARIATITERQLGAIMDHIPCYLPLTAGSDSRMLLACARERVRELALYTVDIPDLGGATDVATATAIARRFDLDHQRLKTVDLVPDDASRWLYRTGAATGEPRGLNASSTFQSLDRSRARLNGQIGDLSKEVYRTSTDHEDTKISVERLAIQGVVYGEGDHYRERLTPSQLEAARSPEVLERTERWKHDAAEPDALRLLDLAYVESRLASWAGVWTYAEYFGPGFTILPLCHSEIIALMVAIPEKERFAAAVWIEIISTHWPELLDFPFNSASSRTTVANKARGGVRRLRRAAGV